MATNARPASFTGPQLVACHLCCAEATLHITVPSPDGGIAADIDATIAMAAEDGVYGSELRFVKLGKVVQLDAERTALVLAAFHNLADVLTTLRPSTGALS